MAITDLDPRLLVEAHNDGDDDAFAQIVRTHHQGLFAHALSRLHEVQAAEDAVQETFVRAYRAMPRFQGEFHLRAWLHRILTNVCHDEGSRRQRDGLLCEKVSSQAVLGGESADADIERVDVSRDVVAAALAALPASYREALVLRYVDDLSYEEVAAATGVTTGNARVRVMRGRVALKRALTSSHALVIGLLPWLRRGGRGPTAVAELQSIGSASVNATAPSLLASTPGLLASSPVLLRAVDAAPQLAERMATLPQVLGLVATLAVPIAAPVVSDQVAHWTAGPAAISAAPAVDDVQVAAAGPSSGVAGGQAPATPVDAASVTTRVGPGTVGAASSNAVLAGGASVLSGAAAATAAPSTTATSAPPVTTSTTSTTSTTALAPAPSSTTVTTTVTAPTTAPTTVVAPTPAVVAPGGKKAAEPAPVAPVAFGASLAGDQITSVGNKRIDLAGAVTWGVGAAGKLAGDLRGTLQLDKARNAGGPTKDTAAAPSDGQPAAGPRTFTGELALSLEDGPTFRLVLSDGALDGPEAGTSMRASFELFDACDGLVASGLVDGNLDLQEAPVPSALSLAFHGKGPGDAPVCG